MAAPVYSDDAAYRARVIAAMAKTEGYPLLTTETPVCTALRYSHLALAVRDVSAAIAFYAKLGFERLRNKPSFNEAASSGADIVRLRHTCGLDLHVVQATDVAVEGNILMDSAAIKYPGHTHASWSVPSVPGVKAFLAGLGIELSGTRSTLAVFVRDTDRTTLEFERNDGGDEAPSVFEPMHVGFGKPLDHVGIRVRDPEARMLWYARAMGFTLKVMTYPLDPNPLKNMPPWISRTPAGCDINFILNANTQATEAPSNILVGMAGLKPGILYPAFEINGDALTVRNGLRAMGADALLDSELTDATWVPAAAVWRFAQGDTVLVRDADGNIIRLVPSGVVDT